MARNPEHNLAGIKLLEELDAEEFAVLERAARWRRYRPKEQIFDRDSDGADLCFVVQGRVQILNFSPSGREISFAQLESGDYFGELAAIDGGTRSASAVAVEETVLASVTAGVFKDLLLKHPRIALEVMLNLTQMVRNADDRIMDLSTLSAFNRVHTELLRMAETLDDNDNAGLISPIPTHSDIASRAGTTRETVSRALSNLGRVRIIERGDEVLKVLDLRRLNDLIEPSYD